MNQLYRDSKAAWKREWKHYSFRYELYGTLFIWINIIAIHAPILEFVEFRKIVIPYNDPVLAILPCYDFSIPIFFTLYISAIVGIISCSMRPRLLLFAIQTYALVQVIRLITLIMVPLDSPTHLVLLHDPLLEMTFYKGNAYTRDLFFSGHVATMSTFYFLEQNKWMKQFFLFALIAMIIMIILQHIHYTIDVIGGIFFAKLCQKLIINYKDVIKLHFENYYKRWKT